MKQLTNPYYTQKFSTIISYSTVFITLFTLFFSCDKQTRQAESPKEKTTTEMNRNSSRQDKPAIHPQHRQKRDYRIVHVFVALCDNTHQGIVPVPTTLGNGQDPANNLYWGALYGVKTFFRKSTYWKPITIIKAPQQAEILDCVCFRRGDMYLIAQAYDGAKMQTTLADFFQAAAGKSDVEIMIQKDQAALILHAGGLSDLVCFVGHNGLMDVRLRSLPRPNSFRKPEEAVVLACKSHAYFTPLLQKVGCEPLITTSGFMAPEAYTLEAIVRNWADTKPIAEIHLAAAKAYANYQRDCTIAAAKRLFKAGVSME